VISFKTSSCGNGFSQEPSGFNSHWVTSGFCQIKTAPVPLRRPNLWTWHDITILHTHTRLMALFPGLPRWTGTRKAKPIWILLKQETVSGSGISWDICKSAPRSRQITTPAPHHSVFYRPDALPATQPTASQHWRHNITILLNFILLLLLATIVEVYNCYCNCRFSVQSQLQYRNNWPTQQSSTLLLHPFNGLFSRTAWVSRYQKGKTSLDLNEARDDGVLGW